MAAPSARPGFLSCQALSAAAEPAVITSADGGRSWTAPRTLGPGGAKVGADFPKVAAGPRPGDFRVA